MLQMGWNVASIFHNFGHKTLNMKTLKLSMATFFIVLYAFIPEVTAQTIHYQFESQIDNWVLSCEATGNSFSISGTVLYQLNVFVSPKNGKVIRIHNNVLYADIYNTETGEEYQYIDTGANDNLGTWWPEWLGIYPDQPAEGITVASAGLKIVGKGGTIFRVKTLIKITINAKGEIVVDSEKGWIECY